MSNPPVVKGSRFKRMMTSAKKVPRNVWARLFYDLAMFAVFLTLAGTYGIFAATYALMGMTLLRTGAIIAAKERIKKLDWVEFFFVMAFGLATALLHSSLFIKLKPPVFAVLFGVSMVGISLYKGEPFSKTLAEEFNVPTLPDSVWRKIDALILLDLLVNTVVNLTVTFAFSTEVWLLTKLIMPVFDLLILGAMGYVFTTSGVSKDELLNAYTERSVPAVVPPPAPADPDSGWDITLNPLYGYKQHVQLDRSGLPPACDITDARPGTRMGKYCYLM